MSKLTFASLSFNENNTPISTKFDDIYFSTQDGLAESIYVFQEGNQLWERWKNHSQSAFVIAETGFGTGLNFFAVAKKFEQFKQENPTHNLQRLYFISFEKYPLTSQQLMQIHTNYPQFEKFSQHLTACWNTWQKGCQRYHFEHIYLDLWLGDILENLPQLGDLYNEKIDAWFLDGFSPDKNPQMWCEELYQHMFRLSKNNGSFATFTAASMVRRGLQAVGFEVKKRKGFAKKREMLWGRKPQEAEKHPIRIPYYYQQPQKETKDIAIVGGGIASLFLSLSLLEKGKKVTLYCKDSATAQNASGNLQGAIYPQLSDDDERNIRFYIHSFDYALQRIMQLESKVEFEHNLSGVALYNYNQKNHKKSQKIAELGYDKSLFHLCNSKQLSEKIGLSVSNGGGFIPKAGWLSPIQFVQNSFALLEEKGLKIILNHEVTNPIYKDNLWQWEHKGEVFSHQTLVLANGHTLTSFTQTEGIPLYPVRGQVSQFPTTEHLKKLKTVLCYDGYLTPASTQRTHCIGASHVRDNTDIHFSIEEHQQNFVKLQQNVTACDWNKNIDYSQNIARIGIRATLRDRIPMVGQIGNLEKQRQQYNNLFNLRRRRKLIENAQSFPQLYTIVGLGSRGLTTAPLLGELLASQICNEPIPLSEDLWHALSPNRVWIRKQLKGTPI